MPAPLDLVLLGVPDSALEEQLSLAAARGDRSAVIFGTCYEPPVPALSSSGVPGPAAPGLRARLAAIAAGAGMALCGGGCMGFVNLAHALRAIGYMGPDPLPRRTLALVTHSRSVFSALLRTRRALGFTLAVSSGQELVTTAGEYARYALDLEETRVLVLVLEAVRLRRPASRSAGRGGRTRCARRLARRRRWRGAAMVAAHSGALAADDGGWEALAEAYGVHRVHDLNELADTAELFAIGRRAARTTRPRGGGDFSDWRSRASRRCMILAWNEPTRLISPSSSACRSRQSPRQPVTASPGLLDPGLEPVYLFYVWGTERSHAACSPARCSRSQRIPAVAAVALAVDLVAEFDGDRSYPLAVLDATERTTKPLVVLSGLASVVDPAVAADLPYRVGSPCSKGCAPACSPCATCWIMRIVNRVPVTIPPAPLSQAVLSQPQREKRA